MSSSSQPGTGRGAHPRTARGAGWTGEPTSAVWDLVVVGAGPAGSAAALGALRARPGARVLLLDRADFPRDKSCGDGVAPHALDELARLGVAARARRPGAGAPAAPAGPRRAGGRRRRCSARTSSCPGRCSTRGSSTAAVAAGARAACGTGSAPSRWTAVADGTSCSTGRSARPGGGRGRRGERRRPPRCWALPRQPAAALAVAVRGYAAAPPGEPEQLIVDGQPRLAGVRVVVRGRRRHRERRVRHAAAAAAGDRTRRPGRAARPAALAAARRARRAAGQPPPAAVDLPAAPARPGRCCSPGTPRRSINPLTGEGIYYALLSGRLAGRRGGRRRRPRHARTARPCEARARPAPAAHHRAGPAHRAARRRRRRGGGRRPLAAAPSTPWWRSGSAGGWSPDRCCARWRTSWAGGGCVRCDAGRARPEAQAPPSRGSRGRCRRAARPPAPAAAAEPGCRATADLPRPQPPPTHGRRAPQPISPAPARSAVAAGPRQPGRRTPQPITAGRRHDQLWRSGRSSTAAQPHSRLGSSFKVGCGGRPGRPQPQPEPPRARPRARARAPDHPQPTSSRSTSACRATSFSTSGAR